MKIHTSLHYHDMLTLLAASGAMISYHDLETLGSRTHTNGFNVTLEGSGGRNNTGMYGSGDYNGATWDEWGAFFGALFEADPEARCGGTLVNPVYRNAGHFHYLTGERFVAQEPRLTKEGKAWRHLPADTHSRHKWEGFWFNGLNCSKCSANRPPFISGKDWS